jgi:phenylacetate-coenzyme A ligase PaaK-like adenylate-forming protein
MSWFPAWHAFGRPVHEEYGSRDIGLMAWQPRPEHSLDFRVNWENVLIEPETDAQYCAILVTKLHADAMPMIRYRIGDEARFAVGSRPGHPSFRLQEVLGRVTDRVWLADGRSVSGLQFPHLLKDFPVAEFMVIQHEDFSLEVQLVPKPAFAPEHARQIKAALGMNLQTVPIAVRLMSAIPHTAAHKWRPVVSEVKRGKVASESCGARADETDLCTSAESLHR